jgi:hypothetical protein
MVWLEKQESLSTAMRRARSSYPLLFSIVISILECESLCVASVIIVIRPQPALGGARSSYPPCFRSTVAQAKSLTQYDPTLLLSVFAKV